MASAWGRSPRTVPDIAPAELLKYVLVEYNAAEIGMLHLGFVSIRSGPQSDGQLSVKGLRCQWIDGRQPGVDEQGEPDRQICLSKPDMMITSRANGSDMRLKDGSGNLARHAMASKRNAGPANLKSVPEQPLVSVPVHHVGQVPSEATGKQGRSKQLPTY